MRDILKIWKFRKKRFDIIISDPQNSSVYYEVIDYSPFRQKLLCNICEKSTNRIEKNLQKTFDIDDLAISCLDIIKKG